MKVQHQVNRENCLIRFAVIGRVVVFALAILAAYALAKPFTCGRIYQNCPCPSEDQSAECSNQVKLAISA